MKAVVVNNIDDFTYVVDTLIDSGYELVDDDYGSCISIVSEGDNVVIYTHNDQVSFVASEYFSEEVDELCSLIGEKYEICQGVDEFISKVKK